MLSCDSGGCKNSLKLVLLNLALAVTRFPQLLFRKLCAGSDKVSMHTANNSSADAYNICDDSGTMVHAHTCITYCHMYMCMYMYMEGYMSVVEAMPARVLRCTYVHDSRHTN